MTLVQLIGLAVQVSMAGMLFSVSLQARPSDLTWLLRQPSLLARSLLAMFVILPLAAVGVALAFDLPRPVATALIALSLAPVPPILPKKELSSGGGPSYTFGLLAAAGILSLVFIPVAAWLLAHAFHRPLEVPNAKLAEIILTSILLPLAAGVALRAWSPRLADRLAKPVGMASSVLLALAFLPVLAAEAKTMLGFVSVSTVLIVAVFYAFGIAIGHLLGGPEPGDRTVLALTNTTRHPAIAMAILHAAPDPKAEMGAVLVVFLLAMLVSIPYTKWRSGAHVDRPSTEKEQRNGQARQE